jgi:SAM-dependent methyltransferase
MTAPQPLDELAVELVRRYGLTAADLVVEVGSGDGALLRAVQQVGPRALGIEPDIKAVTRAFHSGVDTLAAYFCPDVAVYIRRRYGPAELLVTRTVRTTGDDLTNLVAAATRCLSPGGAVVFTSGGVNALVEVRPDLPAVNNPPLARAA